MRMVLLGAVSIGIAFAGLLRAKAFAMRSQALRAFDMDIAQLDGLIGYQALMLAEAMARLAELSRLLGAFWQNAREQLAEGGAVLKAWEAALECDLPHIAALSREDKALLLDFAAGLGASDMHTQRRNIELTRERLRTAHAQAEEKSRRMGKLCRSLGVLGGLAVFIVFM